MRIGPFYVTRASRVSKGEAGAGKEIESGIWATAEAKGRNDALTPFTHPSFMHLPVNFKTAPGRILEPDDAESPRSREAVARVVAAYHRAMNESVEVDRGLWTTIEGSSAKSAFFRALRDRDCPAVGHWLGRMFQNDLVWGLGKVHESMPPNMRANPVDSLVQTRTTDALVSLGQACGVLPVVSVQHQGFGPLLNELDVDLEDLLEKVERKISLDLSCPQVGAGYGCVIGGRFITVDSLLHSHTAYRVRQLGMTPASRIIEIGGGYGCLAALMHRAGCLQYEVFDLPWVNVLQGYFLLMSVPPQDVRLFGEDRGHIRLTPHWYFDRLPDQSVDCVINTDSMPEMPFAARRSYIKGIHRILRGCFLSINQESSICVENLDPQSPVHTLIDEHGGFRLLSRSRWWMVQGYVDEVYAANR